MGTAYISPTGAGLRDGSSWANAATISRLDAMVQKAGAGGTVLLKADAGAYAATYISLTHGGTAGHPVTIKGVNSAGSDMAAQIIGTRATDATALTLKGGDLFVLSGGASNVTFASLEISNVLNAFKVKSDVSNIEVGHVKATNVQRFFENYSSDSTATISGLNIHDVAVTGYSKGVVRLQFDTHDVKITNVVGDSAGQTFESFAMGVHLGGTVHNVVLDRVSMLNNQNFMGTYWNGDGFATERGTHHITFVDTIAKGSTDGGYDLKSSNTTLLRALAEDNGRNFRIWGNDNVMTDSVGLDPHSRSGSRGSQVWLREGADISIVNSQFADSGLNTRVFDFEASGIIKLDRVSVTYAKGAVLKSTSGTLSGSDSSLVDVIAATGAYSSGSIKYITGWSGGPEGSNDSPAPPPVTNVNDAPTGSVAVSGNLTQNAVLSASNTLADADGMGQVSYQWLRDGAAVAGATGSTFTLGQADVGKAISVKASYTDALGSAESVVSAATAKSDKLLGGSGNESIFGGAGNDFLGGGAGSDMLDGGTDDDLLVGGLGSDILIGGAGSDVFLYESAGPGGQDRIRDFTAEDFFFSTSALPDGNGDGIIGAGRNGAFNFGDGSVAIGSPTGGSIRMLEFDGMFDQDGTSYYVYSLVGSSLDPAMALDRL